MAMSLVHPRLQLRRLVLQHDVKFYFIDKQTPISGFVCFSKAVFETTVTRVLLPIPALVLPPFIIQFLER